MFRAIHIHYAEIGETSTFIVKDGATIESVAAGQADGVVCQVLDTTLTEKIVAALNGPDEQEAAAAESHS